MTFVAWVCACVRGNKIKRGARSKKGWGVAELLSAHAYAHFAAIPISPRMCCSSRQRRARACVPHVFARHMHDVVGGALTVAGLLPPFVLVHARRRGGDGGGAAIVRLYLTLCSSRNDIE